MPPRAEWGRFADHFGAARKVFFITADTMTYDFGRLKPLEFAFLDGGHDLEHVINDSRKAYDALAPGGWLVWHDFGSAVPWVKVREAVERMGFAEEVVHVAGTEVAFLRKGALRGAGADDVAGTGREGARYLQTARRRRQPRPPGMMHGPWQSQYTSPGADDVAAGAAGRGWPGGRSGRASPRRRGSVASSSFDEAVAWRTRGCRAPRTTASTSATRFRPVGGGELGAGLGAVLEEVFLPERPAAEDARAAALHRHLHLLEVVGVIDARRQQDPGALAGRVERVQVVLELLVATRGRACRGTRPCRRRSTG